MTFKDLNLIPSILDALEDENYIEPTAIQAKAIPVALKGHDVLASAQTGTGKTAAFAIPILQHLSENSHSKKGRRKITTLVVTPTRELAIQISDSFNTYGRYTKLKNTVVYGGVNQNPQKEALQRGVDILVATPGRLLDLMQQGFISLDNIRYFVLDEADRMLDMGFIPDVKRIIAKLPKKRQSLFFSATMPQNIVELSRQILFRPEKIAVDPVSSTAETIKQYLYMTNKDLKKDLLYHILDDKKIDQVLLFSRTKHGADRIAKILKKKHITCGAIHGDKSQNQRQKALNSFKDGELRVLVATDIAARGIDIDHLRYVINYDIPNEAETYVHRIGRCGRAGEDGVAISMCEPEENAYIRAIEKLTKQRIELVKDNPYPQTDHPMNAEERKAFEKEKQRKKQEFFAARNRKRQNDGGKKKHRAGR